MMEEWLIYLTRQAVILLDGFALVVIVYGTVQAFLAALKIFFIPAETSPHFVWLRYGRWLVAGLTFQLAADIIETSIAPGWEEIGRLAAIAVVRTFLNFFLERDLGELRERSPESELEPRSTADKA
jgi:uncharacterized membrane protein